jgi:hypothetical protein
MEAHLKILMAGTRELLIQYGRKILKPINLSLLWAPKVIVLNMTPKLPE